MPAATLTSKGQITLPVAVRAALGLHAGSKVDFIPLKDGFKVVALDAQVTSLKGRFAGRVKKAVNLADMDKAIAAQAGARNRSR